VSDRLAKVGYLRVGIRQAVRQSTDIRDIRFKSAKQLSLGSFDKGGISILVFAVQDNLTAVLIGHFNATPGTDGIGMLLRRVSLDTHWTNMILAQDILHRVEIMLSHITQSTAVIIPVSPERH